VQRKATKQTRGPNAAEKRFQGWLKEHSCVWCGNPGPGIVDHAKGATFRHNKTLIGHWFCLPVCYECDQKKTIGGKRQGNEAQAWLDLEFEYQMKGLGEAPCEVRLAIGDWNK